MMKIRPGMFIGLLFIISMFRPVFAQTIPRAADGKPDFSGVWAGPAFDHKIRSDDTAAAAVTIYNPNNFPPVKPGGDALLRRKLSGNFLIDDPTAFCLPNGLTRQILAPYPQQWFQIPGSMAVLYEYMHFFRVIPIGAPNRPHGTNLDQTWMGDSIGWWEGETFVIDTVGLKEWVLDAALDKTGEEGHWHSDAAHVVERLKFVEPTLVSYAITIDDPKIFTAPWSQEFQMRLHPKWKLLEYVCEENNRCVGGKCADVQK